MTQLKLSKETIATLANFAGISNSIVVNAGSRISVIKDSKDCIAYADIAETFPKEFGIYDINQFLSAYQLVPEGEIEFDTEFMTISNDHSQLRYNFSDVEYITKAPAEVKFPYEGAIEFALTQDVIESIKNAADRLRLNSISFVSDAGSDKIYAAAIDEKGQDNNSFKILVGKSESIQSNEFNFNLAPNLIKSLIKGDYEVTVSPQGISEFKGMGIAYYIALSGKSSFK